MTTRYTVKNIGSYITYIPEEEIREFGNGTLCAPFFWDSKNEKLDKIASEEFRNSLGDKKKNLMWVQKLKELANWKEGEYIYAYTKTNANGYYNVFYKKDKVKFDWYNIIVEPNGYVAMETYNHYTRAEDDDIKTRMFVRVNSIHNDKNTK